MTHFNFDFSFGFGSRITRTSAAKARRVPCALVLALALAASGCTTGGTAQKSLEVLGGREPTPESVISDAVRSLVVGQFAAIESQLQAEALRRRAELREEIVRRAERKGEEAVALAVEQLAAAMSGPVAELDRDLRELQTRPVQARDRAREFELAVEISTTLAALTRESARLEQRTSARTRVVRSEALALIDARWAELLASPELDLEPSVLARVLLRDYVASGRKGVPTRRLDAVVATAAQQRLAAGRGRLAEVFGELREAAFALLDESNGRLARGRGTQ